MFRFAKSSVVFVFAFSLLLAAGCQTAGPKKVSLEKAKDITVEFQDQAFAPPPRRIEDLTKLLRVAPLLRAEEIAGLQTRASASKPSGLAQTAQAKWYSDRAVAAAELGRSKQALQDFRTAISLQPGDRNVATKIWAAYSHSLAQVGDISGALKARLEAYDVIKGEERNYLRKHSRAAAIAFYQSQLGDLKGAETWIGRAQGHLNAAKAHRSRSASSLGYKPFIPIGETLQNLVEGEILANGGRYGEAESKLRSALTIIEEDIRKNLLPNYELSVYRFAASRVLMQITINSKLAEVLLRQDRFAEAEIIARDAIEGAVARFGRESLYAAQAIDPLVIILGQTERNAEALQLTELALGILKSQEVDDDSFVLNKARHSLASAKVANADWDGALAIFDEINQAVTGESYLHERFYAFDLARAFALIKTGDAELALSITKGATERRTRQLGDQHYHTALARGLYGAALVKTGNPFAALRQFRDTFPILTNRSRASTPAGSSAANRQKLRLIFETYLEALAVEASPEANREAFSVADAARAKTVEAALSRSAARAKIEDPALRDLVRREQDAQKQIEALHGALANALVDGATNANQLRAAIDDLRAARETIMASIESRFPDYARLIDPRPATIDEVRGKLHDNEAMVTLLVGEEVTYSWALSKFEPVKFERVAVRKDALQTKIGALRNALDPQAATLADIPFFDLRLASEVFDLLLAPTRSLWEKAPSLLVVNDGPTGQLPLAVLPKEKVDQQAVFGAGEDLLFAAYRRVPWLIRDHAIAYLPSPTSLASLRQARPANTGPASSFAGFADPFFNRQQASGTETNSATQVAQRGTEIDSRGLPLLRRASPAGETAPSLGLEDLPGLPDTNEEVRAIARALNAAPESDLYLGLRASEAVIKSLDLSKKRVLVFATHGLVAGDLDGLNEPALAMTSPTVLGSKDEDGLLTMSEIMALKLNADWVVLSACNTASGDGRGAESISGLGSAFFYAGARSLMVTSWPVETTSARELTTTVFSLQGVDATLTQTQALQQAKLTLLDQGAFTHDTTPLFSYAHPIFWGPYILVGDAGSRAAGT